MATTARCLANLVIRSPLFVFNSASSAGCATRADHALSFVRNWGFLRTTLRRSIAAKQVPWTTGVHAPRPAVSERQVEALALRRADKEEPITGRGVGYKLFTAGLIPSMSVNDMQKVYRLLRIARERGDIPVPWSHQRSIPMERVAAALSDAALPISIAQATAIQSSQDFRSRDLRRCHAARPSAIGSTAVIMCPLDRG